MNEALNSHTTELRNTLIKIIEMLLNYPEKVKFAKQTLANLEHELLTPRNLISIEKIVFGSTISALNDEEVQLDSNSLTAIKNDLLGTVPYKHTYALKYNFVELLDEVSLEIYQKSKHLLNIIIARINNEPIINNISEEYTNFYESLYDLSYDKLQIKTIADLLVSQISHLLLCLPDDGTEYIDMADPPRYSTIYSILDKEPILPHLDYINLLLKKLEGEVILFVDVHILKEGFAINLR